MSSFAVSGVAFACVLGGVVAGGLLRRRLPADHLTADTRDAVKFGMGLVGTTAALVLGLLVASAKASFDAQQAGVAQLAGNVILLDRALAHCGPEAGDARAALKEATADILRSTWPGEAAGGPAGRAETEGKYEALYDRIAALPARTDAQRAAQAQALKTAVDIGQARWQLYAQRGSSVPPPLVVVLVIWLVVLHASAALVSPPNRTAAAAHAVSALAASSALFLVLEFDRPFQGVIEIPSAPLRNALAHLGKS